MGTEHKVVHQLQMPGTKDLRFIKKRQESSLKLEHELGFKQAHDLESQAEQKGCPGDSGRCTGSTELIEGLVSKEPSHCWSRVAVSVSRDGSERLVGLGTAPQPAKPWGLSQSWWPCEASSSLTHGKVQGATRKAGFMKTERLPARREGDGAEGGGR